MSEYEGLVRCPVEFNCMSLIQIHSRRKHHIALSRTDKDVAAVSVVAVEPVGIVNGAAA